MLECPFPGASGRRLDLAHSLDLPTRKHLYHLRPDNGIVNGIDLALLAPTGADFDRIAPGAGRNDILQIHRPVFPFPIEKQPKASQDEPPGVNLS